MIRYFASSKNYRAFYKFFYLKGLITAVVAIIMTFLPICCNFIVFTNQMPLNYQKTESIYRSACKETQWNLGQAFMSTYGACSRNC